MKRINLALAVMALGLTAFAYSSDALSQASGASSTTQIVVTGEGELFAPADEASFSIGITSPYGARLSQRLRGRPLEPRQPLGQCVYKTGE